MRAFVVILPLVLLACREEPTIVIKFEPRDLSAPPKPADLSPPASPDLATPPKGDECKTADDCVLERVDCCDCSSGGAQQAVPKTKVKALRAQLKAKCKDMVCAAVVSDHPSCASTADCVNGRCVLRKGAAASPPAK